MVGYRIDPGHSRFAVQAFTAGLLSFAGHSPTFLAGDFAGELHWQPDVPEGADLTITVRGDSLELTDKVRPADRAEIENRMRRDVLEVGRYPDIRFQSNEIMTSLLADKQYRLHIIGDLSLHGVARRQVIEAESRVFDDGVRLTGKFQLRMSDYHIRPVSALAGMIRLKDELQLSFDIAAVQEAP